MNIALDILDRHKKVKDGSIHNGFLIAWNGLRTKLTKTIDEIKTQNPNPNLKLEFVVFGHSLGGALASLVAYYLGLQKKIIINSVWTFGSPRVGDYNFAKHYTENKTWPRI